MNLFLLSIILGLTTQFHALNTGKIVLEQDSTWRQITNGMELYAKLNNARNIQNEAIPDQVLEKQLLTIRDLGLVYWNRYPNSANAILWLQWTVGTPPSYFDFDSKTRNKERLETWNKSYRKIKNDFLSHLKTTDSINYFRERLWLNMTEARGNIKSSEVAYRIANFPFDKKKYFEEFVRLAHHVNNTDFAPSFHSLVNDVVIKRKLIGLEESDVRSMLKMLKEQNLPELTEWCTKREYFLDLSAQSVDWVFESLVGDSIKFAEYRGKVVLVDFWASYCTSCIAYMPAIQQVYNKYKSHGFDVISISIDNEKRKPNVLQIESRLELTWPIAVIGSTAEYRDIWKKFGFNGVPQLLLLDREGKLVATNSELLNVQGLENEVKRFL